MIASAGIEDSIDESLLNLGLDSVEEYNSRFSDLRGVQWRINLGILPSSATTDELRRVTANARRRYAGFRRRLLVDPHIFKDGSTSPDLVMDNPLSQNPDSMWGQFFRNAELEKMLDQDLSRLYPEDGSYFQTPASQGILRRILLLWCLRHPEYGYRQGMHELLAPLLYVLHVDVQHLAEVRKVYDHHFNDRFDDMSFPQSDLVCNYKSLKLAKEAEDANSLQGHSAKSQNPDELDPKIKAIVLLTDAYGAEGELGILLSERFMEHDAYCMFDALMTGACGAVAMAEYYSISPSLGSHTGLPSVIEASSALYHLLSFVDSSLHSHLIELGVEPQYFALRWLRVLYGREFVLEDLLTIWDEIFASGNNKPSLSSENEESSFAILQSPRGAFIAAMAVSMLLQLRSSLLSTETATSCLQRLLNFPENVDVKKLIEKAKSLQSLALDTRVCLPAPIPSKSYDRSKSSAVHSHSLSSGSISPRTPLSLVPESYWEEKWRVLHNEEAQQGITTKYSSSGKQRLTEKIGLSLGLGRTESDPSHLKLKGRKKQSNVAVRRSLLDDLSRALGEDEDLGDSKNDPFSTEGQIEEETSISRDFHPVEGETSQSGHIDSEENSFVFSASSSPLSTRDNDNDNNNDSGRSSVASNSSTDQSDAEPDSSEERNCEVINSDPPLPESNCEVINSDPPLPDSEPVIRTYGKPPLARKPLSGRFQWLWKLGKNANDVPLPSRNDQNDVPAPTTVEETKDKNVIGSLKNLGHSMLENIQVIETVIQQERNQSMENLSKNVLVGKGQVTAVAALKELRKISNVLSEM